MWFDHDADENSRRLLRKLSCSVIKDRISSPLPDQVDSLLPSSLLIRWYISFRRDQVPSDVITCSHLQEPLVACLSFGISRYIRIMPVAGNAMQSIYVVVS